MSVVHVQLSGELKRHIKALFIENAEDLVQAYLATLPNDDEGEFYGSYLAVMAGELDRFVKWLKTEMELSEEVD